MIHTTSTVVLRLVDDIIMKLNQLLDHERVMLLEVKHLKLFNMVGSHDCSNDCSSCLCFVEYDVCLIFSYNPASQAHC